MSAICYHCHSKSFNKSACEASLFLFVKSTPEWPANSRLGRNENRPAGSIWECSILVILG